MMRKWIAALLLFAVVSAVASRATLRERAYSALMRDNGAMSPFAIAPGLYYVGSSDIAVFAIATAAGLIVIDGGYETTAPMVLENLRQLGFEPHAVQILLASHAHFDHASGLAWLKAETGAKLYASPEDATLLESGGRGDFYLADWMTFPKVVVDRRLHDGEEVKLGEMILTAHFTPGHTKGCTSWSFPLQVDGAAVQALAICSLSILRYRLVGNDSYPNIAADFQHSFALLQQLPCELFLGAHGSFFDLHGKRAKQRAGTSPNPFVDGAGCKAFIEARQKIFLKALRQQGGDVNEGVLPIPQQSHPEVR